MAPKAPTNSELITALQTSSLLIAVDLLAKIQASQGQRMAEYPIELLKLMGSAIKVADDLNGISLASSIERVSAAGYKITTEE